ncbi:MAG: hypothetical protein KDB88_06420 [Flavobacteriales bacterium]|nr:hypothetical protein [Flavobacteriales bacterium]
MGIVTMGIPHRIAIELAKAQGCKTFIETGTFEGGTTRWARKHFGTVHTIELSEHYHGLYSAELEKIGGVHAHLGDSRKVLPGIVASLGDTPAIHWLDGHWSGGSTSGAADQCPLMGELACIAHRTQDVILIDDARLFLSTPQRPHDPGQWPSMVEIVTMLTADGAKRAIQVIDDVIFCVPKGGEAEQCLIDYAQERSAEAWIRYKREAQGHPAKALARKILSKVRS